MSFASTNKVSFTIRRPTPVSRGTSSGGESGSESFKVPLLPRHLANDAIAGSPLARSATSSPKPNARTYADRDSSDEEDVEQDELVTAIDQMGVKRLHEKKTAPQGPLVIPPLQNRDWREFARKRKSLYIPPSAAAETGADGSVGGLGTRDTINSGPQYSGIQQKKRIKVDEDESMSSSPKEPMEVAEKPAEIKEEETEDQRALRAILAAAQSSDNGIDGPVIDIIPAPSEDDAYRQDVEELPESATLNDYERVPVSQFGAALLRGMGWKEGTSASKKNRGLVEPWLPQSRPALLGIGAKEKEAVDDGSTRKKGKSRPERRYVPVVKKERPNGERSGTSEGDERGSRSSSSKRRSPSPKRDRDRHDKVYAREEYKGRDRRDDRRDRGSRSLDKEKRTDRPSDGRSEHHRERNRRDN